MSLAHARVEPRAAMNSKRPKYFLERTNPPLTDQAHDAI
jgi:hypothetical protein